MSSFSILYLFLFFSISLLFSTSSPPPNGLYLDDSNILEIESENHYFQVVNEHDGPLITLFYASWCGHCRNFAKPFKTLAAKVTDTISEINNSNSITKAPNVKFIATDCATFSSFCNNLKITFYPCLYGTNFNQTFAADLDAAGITPKKDYHANKLGRVISRDQLKGNTELILKYINDKAFQNNQLSTKLEEEKPIGGKFSPRPLSHISSPLYRLNDARQSILYLLENELPGLLPIHLAYTLLDLITLLTPSHAIDSQAILKATSPLRDFPITLKASVSAFPFFPLNPSSFMLESMFEQIYMQLDELIKSSGKKVKSSSGSSGFLSIFRKENDKEDDDKKRHLSTTTSSFNTLSDLLVFEKEVNQLLSSTLSAQNQTNLNERFLSSEKKRAIRTSDLVRYIRNSIPKNYHKPRWFVCGERDKKQLDIYLSKLKNNDLNTALRGTSPFQPHYEPAKGYSCGLWMLFHLLLNRAGTLQGDFSQENQLSVNINYSDMASIKIMRLIRNVVAFFFRCQGCRAHFLHYYNSCKFGRCDVVNEFEEKISKSSLAEDIKYYVESMLKSDRELEHNLKENKNRLLSTSTLSSSLSINSQLQLWLFKLHNLVTVRIALENLIGKKPNYMNYYDELSFSKYSIDTDYKSAAGLIDQVDSSNIGKFNTALSVIEYHLWPRITDQPSCYFKFDSFLVEFNSKQSVYNSNTYVVDVNSNKNYLFWLLRNSIDLQNTMKDLHDAQKGRESEVTSDWEPLIELVLNLIFVDNQCLTFINESFKL